MTPDKKRSSKRLSAARAQQQASGSSKTTSAKRNKLLVDSDNEDWVEPKRQSFPTKVKEEDANALKRRKRSPSINTKAAQGDGPLPGYKPRSHMTRYSGTNIKDRDDWLTKVQATLLRDSVRLDRDGPRAASMYLRGEAANWHQHTYWPIHKDDTPLSWNNFVKELKDRFFQEDKKGTALRIARQVAFEDLEQLLSTFANLNKLYPQRDIIEVTYDFAYKLPSTHSGLRDELVRQLPKDFQELWVRVRAWKGRQPRKIAA